MLRFLFLVVILFAFSSGSSFSFGNFREHASVKRIHAHFTKTNDVFQIDRPWVYDNGILFTYNGKVKGMSDQRTTGRVFISGSFVDWKKKIPLKKNERGIYLVFLEKPLKKGLYRYRFWVNGLWVNDLEQPFVEFDQNGERVSYFVLEKDITVFPQKSPELIPASNVSGLKRYRFYLKDKNYREVFWLSSQTGWNPYTYPMRLVDGYWVFDRIIDKDQLYIFWVDGEKMLDPLNHQIYLNSFGVKANLVKAP